MYVFALYCLHAHCVAGCPDFCLHTAANVRKINENLLAQDTTEIKRGLRANCICEKAQPLNSVYFLKHLIIFHF